MTAATLGTAAVAGRVIHDGELGAPSETIRGGMPWIEGAADSPPELTVAPAKYVFFAAAEASFIEAALDRLIPADPVGPGAVEAGVAVFIDRQLAGPFGRGDHFYLGGPWPKGTAEQGYQSRHSPAQLYRAAIAAIGTLVRTRFDGRTFAELDTAMQDDFLRAMEKGEAQFDQGVSSKQFFAMLLQNTREGYFADPIYGGNRDMAAWKMIGFPGARYNYREWVSRHGEASTNAPVGLKGRLAWREVP